MATGREFGRRLRANTQRMIEQSEIPGLTGLKRDNGTITLQGNGVDEERLDTGQIYVRRYGNDNDVIVAWGVNIGKKANTDVIIKRNHRGEYEAIRLDSRPASQQMGSAAENFATPAKDSDAGLDLIGGRSLKPGMVYLTSTTALTVKAWPFWYRYFDQMIYYAGSDILDLTAYLPVTTDYYGWAWVAVDPTTNSLTAQKSDEVAALVNANHSLLQSTNMRGLIPCDAVRVQEGQTTWDNNVNKFEFGRAVTPGLGIPMPLSIADVSNPPTDAELDAEFGTPADVGAGYMALIDDNGAGTAGYLVWSDGTNWWVHTGTKAT